MTTQVKEKMQVGWLEGGNIALCLICKDHGDSLGKVVPLFLENIKPYRQTCACCGIELNPSHCNVMLFNGKL